MTDYLTIRNKNREKTHALMKRSGYSSGGGVAMDDDGREIKPSQMPEGTVKSPDNSTKTGKE